MSHKLNSPIIHGPTLIGAPSRISLELELVTPVAKNLLPIGPSPQDLAQMLPCPSGTRLLISRGVDVVGTESRLDLGGELRLRGLPLSELGHHFRIGVEQPDDLTRAIQPGRATQKRPPGRALGAITSSTASITERSLPL